MHVFGLIAAMWAPLAHGGGCGTEELREAADDSVQAFSDMDEERFDASTAVLHTTLKCQAEAISGADCARVHLNQGLNAFLAEDAPSAILAFRAALDADPTIRLADGVAPQGHPLRELFDTARGWSAVGSTRAVPRPAEGHILVDGEPQTVAPMDRPFVFQHVQLDESVATSAYVRPGEVLPAYETRAGTQGAEFSVPSILELPVARNPPPRWLTGAGVALGVVSLGAVGGSYLARTSYDRAVEEGSEAQIKRMHGTTNGLFVGGVLGTLAGAGLVVVGQL